LFARFEVERKYFGWSIRMNSRVNKLVVLATLLIRSVIVEANIQAAGDSTTFQHMTSRREEIISNEFCPRDNTTFIIMHCDVLEKNDASDFPLFLHELEGYPREFGTLPTSSGSEHMWERI
jgi:hypothetical protein